MTPNQERGLPSVLFEQARRCSNITVGPRFALAPDRKVEVPGLRVLDVTRDAFIRHAREQGLLQCSLNTDDAAATIAKTLANAHDKQTLLARAFLDLWYCANFSASAWYGLIEMDAAHAALAVEACYYVFAMSGANAASELRELLVAHDQVKALEAVGFAEPRDSAREWLATVQPADTANSRSR